MTMVSGAVLWTGTAGAAPGVPTGGFPGGGVAADSALAVFLIGLAVGVPLGIVLCFAYLVAREKRPSPEALEIENLLASAAQGENVSENVWGLEEAGGRETFEPDGTEDRRDPWERPADWWRHAGDDA